jgi:hypothetical protein
LRPAEALLRVERLAEALLRVERLREAVARLLREAVGRRVRLALGRRLLLLRRADVERLAVPRRLFALVLAILYVSSRT